MRKLARLLSLFYFSFYLLTLVSANFDFLTIELFAELEPINLETVEAQPATEETILRSLLEEARKIFSGMIYGYSFKYIPADKSRQVNEFFDCKLLGEIKWGDKNLKILKRQIIANRLYVQFSYELEPFQQERLKSWSSLLIPYAMGNGVGLLIQGALGKETSLAMAIKEALRNYLRPQIFNKPREIRGEVLLLETPLTIIYAGAYRTTVKIKINLRELIPYKIY